MTADRDRPDVLRAAWDSAAAAYDRYFVPRFAPWTETAVAGLGASLPPGPILVPCCGSFPELPLLARHHLDRPIIGIDLSPGMLALASERLAAVPLAEVREGDATDLRERWPGTAAAVMSVFGLQQLPDPAYALRDWLATLRPGGRLSVMFWPDRVETTGPFAVLDELLHGGRSSEPCEPALAEVLRAAGATVHRDETLSFPMTHPDAATFFAAVTNGGPLRTLALTHGDAFVADLREAFLGRAPTGPWTHQPGARYLLATSENHREADGFRPG
jgi:SAM-dependent methyltransferase